MKKIQHKSQIIHALGRSAYGGKSEILYMPRLTKDEAIKTIQHRRSQIQAIIRQNIPARELGRKFKLELDQSMFCCLLSDVELGLLSAEYLNDIIEHGWWSEVGRMHLRKLMGCAGGTSS